MPIKTKQPNQADQFVLFSYAPRHAHLYDSIRDERGYHIRHGLLLASFTGLINSGDKVRPSCGVFYVVKSHGQWQVMAYRYADLDEEIDHSAFWERYVVGRLPPAWTTDVADPFADIPEKIIDDPERLERYLQKRSAKHRAEKEIPLTKQLKKHPYGFPRGRVACVHGAYRVYHGSDIPNSSKIKRDFIEVMFGIKGKAKWIEDDHEHCLMADKEAVRDLLAIEEDWEAV